MRSRSPWKSKSFSHPKVIPMSRNAVPHADSHGKNDRAVPVRKEITPATSHNAKCSPLPVHAAEKQPKYRLNPEKADRFIAVIATTL